VDLFPVKRKACELLIACYVILVKLKDDLSLEFGLWALNAIPGIVLLF
jgi:hypothetical protein